MLSSTKGMVAALLCISPYFLVSCGQHDVGAHNIQLGENQDGKNVVNFYNWADNIAPDTISSFEKKTGIKVNVTYFETEETLESRLLTGHSGFDVVVPAASLFLRQIRSGAYLPLDKKELPNLVNIDPAFMSRVAINDPGNAYSVLYSWGTFGVGYNEKMVAKVLPNVPVDSWRLIFDPKLAAKLGQCGILILDAPAAVLRLVLIYLGRDPNAPSPKDLADAEKVLANVRPYIRSIDSSADVEALANGDICIAVGYNSDFVQARARANEARNGNEIGYVIPQEGSLLWFLLLAIPRDAPHIDNAHRFINYLMDPQVTANMTKSTGNANANPTATSLLDASTRGDKTIYPSLQEQQRLLVQMEDSQEQSRAITRIWQKFKTAQ
jgi:putrescine transport system substrate-binding protein